MKLRPKFIADADLNERIVEGLRKREPAVDVLSSGEGGTRGLSDLEVLRIAASTGRVLVSHDSNTMIAHFKQFIAGSTSPGFLIVRQEIPIGRAIDEILLLWNAEAEDLLNQVKFAASNPAS